MIPRPATPADAPFLVALLQEIVDQGGTTAFEGQVPATKFDAYITNSDGQSACQVVQSPEGDIIGVQYVTRDPAYPAGMAVIATFAKLGTTQGGIGTALFSATRPAAIALGYTAIDATIRADNSGGLRYYSKMGFEDYEVISNIPLKDGTLVDRISKRLTL